MEGRRSRKHPLFRDPNPCLSAPVPKILFFQGLQFWGHWVGGTEEGTLFHSRMPEWVSGHWVQPQPCGHRSCARPSRHAVTSTTASLKQTHSLLRGDVEAGFIRGCSLFQNHPPGLLLAWDT